METTCTSASVTMVGLESTAIVVSVYFRYMTSQVFHTHIIHVLCCSGEDSCASNPCKNGVCENNSEGFTCVCMNGFTGDTCETRELHDLVT